MTTLKAAAQLFTLRDFLKTEDDFAESMKKVRDIGYKAIQVSGIGPIPHATVKKIADANGLTICSTHVGFESLQNDPEAMIAQHKLWECPNVAIGGMPGEYRESGEGYIRFAAAANEVGKHMLDAGLTFSYHNHSFEFERFGDRLGLEIVYEESDPRYVQAELDTYWVQHGGGDPVEWIRRMHNRMPVVHFKDMGMENGEPYMAEVGEGVQDWPEIIKACRESGVKWAAVEQDVCRRDPFESLAISLKNLAGLGVQ